MAGWLEGWLAVDDVRSISGPTDLTEGNKTVQLRQQYGRFAFHSAV
jgi:hypothetical protein